MFADTLLSTQECYLGSGRLWPSNCVAVRLAGPGLFNACLGLLTPDVRTLLLRTWQWAFARGKSRPGRPAALTATPSTTSSCASRPSFEGYCLFVCLFVCLSVCLSVGLFDCFFVCLVWGGVGWDGVGWGGVGWGGVESGGVRWGGGGVGLGWGEWLGGWLCCFVGSLFFCGAFIAAFFAGFFAGLLACQFASLLAS